MPMVNYCRKCKRDTPLGDSCPFCGGKLTKTGERISFGVARVPVKEWFEWNRILRVGLPALALVLVIVVCAEAAASGKWGVLRLFQQGFSSVMLALLGGLLAAVLVLLCLQGAEKVHYVMDRDGVKAYTYLPNDNPLRLYARFLTPAAADALRSDDDALPDLTLVRRVILPWSELRRVRVWREGSVILFFRPAGWQVLSIPCPIQELPECEAYVRAKLKRFKKVKVLPALPGKKLNKKQSNVTQM